MDVNYSRWMSKDPDAEPDVIEDEPRRFRLTWPTRSAVASTAMVSVIVLGGAALVRSFATPDVSADQVQTVETPTAKESAGPGAASVEESESNDYASDDYASDDYASDDYTSDDSWSEGSASDDSTTSDWSAPAGPPPGPRRIYRREFGAPGGAPQGPPPRFRRAFRP